MQNGKHQCHMAASCTYHLPIIISYLLNQSHTKKVLHLKTNIWEFSGRKSREWTISRKMTRQKEQEDEAEKTREETERGIKWQPWDSRQEGNISHPRPPFGVNMSQVGHTINMSHVGHIINMSQVGHTINMSHVGHTVNMSHVGHTINMSHIGHT